MGNTIKNIKKAGIGLGILALSYFPAKSQNFKPLVTKAGIACNIIQTDRLSKDCLGIEALLEEKLKKRLSAELETGFYTDTYTNTILPYSKMQANLGLKYKPIMKDGWAIGGKAAIGVSSEFYKEMEQLTPYESVFMNKLIGIDVEKIFNNKAGINFGVSREIDRNAWRFGVKIIFKPESKKQHHINYF